MDIQRRYYMCYFFFGLICLVMCLIFAIQKTDNNAGILYYPIQSLLINIVRIDSITNVIKIRDDQRIYNQLQSIMAESQDKGSDLFSFSHIHSSQDFASINSWLEQPSMPINFNQFSFSSTTGSYTSSIEQSNYFCQLPINIRQPQLQNDSPVSNQSSNIFVDSVHCAQDQHISINPGQSSLKNAVKIIRKDLDGQSVFKLANYGLRAICKQYGYEKLIDFNGPQSQKSKDYFVSLLCYMEANILKNNPVLFFKIPQLYAKAIKPKISKTKSKLNLAKTEKQQNHAQHSLQVYENAKRVLEAYFNQKDAQRAMMLAYGANIKFNNRLQKAITNMRALRKKLGLNQYIIESQVKLS